MIIEIANRSQAVVRAEHGPMERNLSLAQRSGLANVGCPGFQMPRRDLVLWKLWLISITCCGFFSCGRVMVWGYFQGFRSAGCLQMRPTVVIAMLFTSGWYDRFKVPPLHLSICLWPQSPCSSAMLMAKFAKRSGWEIGAGCSNFRYVLRCPYNMLTWTWYIPNIRLSKDECNNICRSMRHLIQLHHNHQVPINCPTFRCLKPVGGFKCDFDHGDPQFDFSVGLNLPTKIFFIMLISSLDVHLHPS